MTEPRTADLLALDPEAQDLLFREARTANAFTDEPVAEEQLQAIYDLVKWAPTSMNIQPLRVVLVQSGEARERLLPHLAEGNRAKTGSAPAVAVLAVDTEFHEELPRTFPHVPAAKDMFAADDDFRCRAGELNAALQVGYFILGVRAAGLAAGPMTGFDTDGVTREFLDPNRQRALVVVNIGYPAEDAWAHRLPRLDYDEVVTTV
ncbi:malonic semialdehyde reductase [Ornithinicoccus halotolerans]|uniref:malonic semialdehyde reductase n=1 Tax=Ornithinicoccus halotolerans TaxID=1748220 RepID=UPI0012968323|nr:malonic semialdehyde reductase [Ornithinicoccus halotolerans]